MTGFISQMKRELGARDSSVASRELKRPDAESDAQFMRELREAREANNVSPLHVMAFDETNAQFFPEAKRVQTAPSELGGKARRRVRRRLGGREGFTVCATYSVAAKGKLLFLFDRCPTTVLAMILEHFGDRVVIYTRYGRWMNGSTHAHGLPLVVVPFCNVLRDNYAGHHEDSSENWIVYIEDDCASHRGDKCDKTQETGLVALRQECFDGNRIDRQIIHGGGTPERAPPDQAFKILKALAYDIENAGFVGLAMSCRVLSCY